VTTREWPEQRLADLVRVHCERGIAELQHGGGNGFREPPGNCSSCGRPWPSGQRNCASYLMMRPPSAHSTWPVMAAAASEAR
jgi:hypothetical protein